MVLKIDYEVFRLVMAEKEEYVFDAVTYAICEKGSEEAEFFDYPIPMPFTEKMKLYKAYVETFSPRIRRQFAHTPDERAYMGLFWYYADDDGEKSERFGKFEDMYYLRKLVDWCEMNHIAYYIDKSDWYLKSFVSEFQKNNIEKR